MRINKYVALATGISRRSADKLIEAGRIKIGQQQASFGSTVESSDNVFLDKVVIKIPEEKTTILLNKPSGYICSRDGQGSKTIYELIPNEYSKLKPVGRLDKDSSGLILLSDDGDMAHKLTHPSFIKEKTYIVQLDKPLQRTIQTQIEKGIKLNDGISSLKLKPLGVKRLSWQINMHEGRNRQIRRTFASAGYSVLALQRIKFGEYSIDNVPEGKFIKISNNIG